MMIFRFSLKQRIKIAFCGFGLILALCYWLFLDISVNLAEDMIFENRLKNEITAFLTRHAKDPSTPAPSSAYIRGYLGRDNVPESLKETISGLSLGFYETDGPSAIQGPKDFHVAVAALPGTRDRLYLFFDVGTLKVTEEYERIFRTFLFFSTIAVALVGGVIGGLIARQVLAPVTRLAGLVARTSPDNLSITFSDRFADDEVGFLARTLEEHMERIRDFIEREKAFTRDASHELRTPVTVIKGALELLARISAGIDPAVQRPLNRIGRAANEMTATIETFLWLAREDKNTPEARAVDVAAEVQAVTDEQTAIFREKPVTAELRADHCPVIQAPPAVFRIVMNNLIGNAFHYTANGRVRITVLGDRVEIFNSGRLTLPDSSHPFRESNEGQGFGFGLAIVRRLSERFGWQLYIDSEQKGTRVSLVFLKEGP